MKNKIFYWLLIFVTWNLHSFAQTDTSWMARYQIFDSVIFNPYVIFAFEDTVNNLSMKDRLDRNLIRYNTLKEGLPEKGIVDNSAERTVSITYLPTFANPIFVSASRKGNKFTLTWAVRKGMGGYDFKGIKRSGRISITDKDWNHFLQIIDIKSFDSLPVDMWYPMVDGVGWVVEISEKDKHVIHFTNWPNEKIEGAFQFLLHFTNQKVEQANLRHGEILVNKHNQIVSQATIMDSISSFLNQNLPEDFRAKCCLTFFDLKIKISSNGRITRVRHLSHKPFKDPGELTDDIAFRVTERGCRRAMFDVLKGIDLSGFYLPETWIEVIGFNIRTDRPKKCNHQNFE